MLSVFNKETQRSFDIGGVVFGGVPGSRATVMVGSLFYLGDNRVLDYKLGEFDKSKVKKDLENASLVSIKNGIPLALELIAMSPKAMSNYLAYAVEHFDGPILIGGVDESSRIAGYELALKLGVQKRVLANAIYVNTGAEELNVLRECRIEAGVLMAFDFGKSGSTLKPEGKIEVIKNNLLPKAEKAGITKPLVDVAVLDIPSISLSGESVWAIKSLLGIPAGCAPVNAISQLGGGIKRVERLLLKTASMVFLQMMGADFLFYGALQRIEEISSAISLADSYTAYLYKIKGGKVPESHPLNLFLPELLKRASSNFQR
ncbi:MAG: hypothetical protein QXH91_07860 [Candidatus Bathyarchaeia archaeon]